MPLMPRSLQHSAEFAHPVEKVLAALTDEDALRERLAAVGGQNAELLSHEKSAAGVSYTMRQGIPADKLPGVISKLHPGDLIVTREQTWRSLDDGTARGTGKAHVSGVPGAITVETQLLKHADGAKLQVSGQVKVSVPLIGGKIEQTIAEQVGRLLTREDAFVAKQLDAR